MHTFWWAKWMNFFRRKMKIQLVTDCRINGWKWSQSHCYFRSKKKKYQQNKVAQYFSFVTLSQFRTNAVKNEQCCNLYEIEWERKKMFVRCCKWRQCTLFSSGICCELSACVFACEQSSAKTTSDITFYSFFWHRNEWLYKMYGKRVHKIVLAKSLVQRWRLQLHY